LAFNPPKSAGRTHAAGSSRREAEVAKFLAADLKSAEGRAQAARAPRQRHRFDAARIVAADCFVSLSRTLFGLRGAPFPLVSWRGT
jgi:hypothetical protein